MFMIDDIIVCNICLALTTNLFAHFLNPHLKRFLHSKFLKCLISQLVVPIEALFLPSPPEFDEFHNNIIFCCATILPQLLKILQPQTERTHTVATCQSNRGCTDNYADYVSMMQ